MCAVCVSVRVLPRCDLLRALLRTATVPSLTLRQLYSSQGRYQDAKEYYERLLQIIKLHRGLNHKETAHCLAMVGSFYMQFGKASNAEPLLYDTLWCRA